MAFMTDYLRNKLVDWLLRQQVFVPPSTLYIGLDTAAAGHTVASGTEVTAAGSYARIPYVSSLADWSGTQSAGSTTASSGTGAAATSSNNAAIVFAAPTGNWGTINGWRAWDALSGGNPLFFGPMAVPKTVNNGDAAPSFVIGALALTFDN